jgi:hypothetical protein
MCYKLLKVIDSNFFPFHYKGHINKEKEIYNPLHTITRWMFMKLAEGTGALATLQISH